MSRCHMSMECLPADAGRAQVAAWLRATLATVRPSPPSQPTARTHEGADHAFEGFFWRFERKVFGYLWRMVGDEQAARDLTQETFLRAWEHFQQIAGHRDNGSWLFRVASNLALTHLRRRAAVPMVALDDDAPGKSDHGRRIAERDAVEQTLLLLQPRQRSVLVLHEVYDLTCDEIGAIMGISRDAAKMALWRARESFRTHYLREESQP